MKFLTKSIFNLFFIKKFSVLILLICLILSFTACGGGGGSDDDSDDGMPEIKGMVWIKGGTFTMGSPDGTGGTTEEPSRQPNETQHSVTVSGFYMGKYAVTQKEYKEVMGYNPSDFTGDNLPVEMVAWYDAVEFCNKLSEKEGLEPVYTIKNRVPATGYPITDAKVTANWSKKGYRLPTEAEWEYACRADTTTPFSTGNNITTDQANYDGNYPYNSNPTGIYRGSSTVVGSFAHNAWGLYDMHGNVYEWCWDLYGAYPVPCEKDYRGADTGSDRVIRGGSWYDYAEYLRSAFRFDGGPGDRHGNLGFRVVRP